MKEEIALFPLNAVLFPGGQLPLRIFENRYMDMAKACLKGDLPFGVCLILEGQEVGEPALPAEIGTLARIVQWDMPQLGVLQVIARGEHRFRIVERRVQPDGLARAEIEVMAADADCEVPEDCAHLSRLLERVIAQQPDALEPPHRLHSGSWVSARLAELLPIGLRTKQELLELGDARTRLERLKALVGGAARNL